MKIIPLLILLCLIVWLWYESMRLREQVIRRCQLLCRQAQLQFLDQSVALVSISLRRDSHGLPRVHRKYQFAISNNGADRYPAYVSMCGDRMMELQYQGPDQERIILQTDHNTLH